MSSSSSGAVKKTSFVKRQIKPGGSGGGGGGGGHHLPVVLGARPSLSNNQLLISSGVPSLDSTVLGGGFPIGTLIGFREKDPHKYSKLLSKFFSAQGVSDNHGIFVATPEKKNEFLSNLPDFETSVAADDEKQEKQPDEEEDLKIAWRYKNLKIADDNPLIRTNKVSFDLGKSISAEKLAETQTFHFIPEVNLSTFENKRNSFVEIIKKIREILSENKRYTLSKKEDTGVTSSVLRIVIHDLDSVLWSKGEDDESDSELTRFLWALKSILRNNLCCAFLIFDNDDDDDDESECYERICDFMFEMEAFSESGELNKIFKDHHGLLEVVKIANLNCLTNSSIPAKKGMKFLFKSFRTKFVLEKMHLPPDLDFGSSSSSSLSSSKKPEQPVMSKHDIDF